MSAHIELLEIKGCLSDCNSSWGPGSFPSPFSPLSLWIPLLSSGLPASPVKPPFLHKGDGHKDVSKMNVVKVAECLWILLLSATTINFVLQRVSRTYLIFSDLRTDTSLSCLWKPMSFLPKIISNRPSECLLKRGEKLLSAFVFPGEQELLWGSRQALCCSLVHNGTC